MDSEGSAGAAGSSGGAGSSEAETDTERTSNESMETEENVDSGVTVDKSESSGSSAGGSTSRSTSRSTTDLFDAEPSTSVARKFDSIRSEDFNPDRFKSLYKSPLFLSRVASILDSDDDTGMDLDSSSTRLNNEDDDNDDDDDDDDDAEDDMDEDSDSSILNSGFEDYADINEDNTEDSDITPTVLLKRKPAHKWSVIKEIMKRETGTIMPPGKTGRTNTVFEQKFYGSLHTVERLELMYKLNKHLGCVNSLNFHPEGHLLVSGSDDLNLIVWDWPTNAYRHVVKTDHKLNIFQSKFLHLNAASQLNIVSCARDGQVLLTQVPTSGGLPMKRKLAQHNRSAHKLYTNRGEPHIVISSGEDAQVILSDVRQEKPNKLFTVKSGQNKIALYSISGHPLNVNEMCVAGKNRHVMIYDRRKVGPLAEPIKKYGIEESENKKGKYLKNHITSAIYNHDGSEILASFNEEDIYIFDTSSESDLLNNRSGYCHTYSGHRNTATFKGASYFGPQSEFIASGSDCGNIYIWEKKSEAIVQWMMGDEGGVVNCLECHPSFPVLATSGLDKDVKIWVPSNENDPKLEGLREVVIRNARPLMYFLPRFYYSHEPEMESDGRADNLSPDERFDEPSCAGF